MLGETRRKLLAREFDDQWTANALIEASRRHDQNHSPMKENMKGETGSS